MVSRSRVLAMAGGAMFAAMVVSGVSVAQLHEPAPPAEEEATPPAESTAEPAMDGAMPTSLWEGVFTAEQAERGWEPYNAECDTCHGATLRGTPGAPRIIGSAFRNKWEGESLESFVQWLTDNMPAGRGGTLTAQIYADLTALILQENGYPAGEAELIPGDENLQNIVFTPPPEE